MKLNEEEKNVIRDIISWILFGRRRLSNTQYFASLAHIEYTPLSQVSHSTPSLQSLFVSLILTHSQTQQECLLHSIISFHFCLSRLLVCSLSHSSTTQSIHSFNALVKIAFFPQFVFTPPEKKGEV